MVKAKAKGSVKKSAPRAAAKRPAPAARTKAAAKYEQPGAPWWKKLPLPEPH